MDKPGVQKIVDKEVENIEKDMDRLEGKIDEQRRNQRETNTLLFADIKAIGVSLTKLLMPLGGLTAKVDSNSGAIKTMIILTITSCVSAIGALLMLVFTLLKEGNL